jgi:hypothetical protein
VNSNNNKKDTTSVRTIYTPENIMQIKEHDSKKKESEMRRKQSQNPNLIQNHG